MPTSLTQEQIETIKQFPEPVLQTLRKALHYLPEHKNDYKWILDGLIAECKRTNLPIPNILKKHGFSNMAAKAVPVANKPWTKPQEKTYSHEQANAEIERIYNDTQSFNNIANLLGKEHAQIYQRKLIENIISHTKE